MKKMKQIISLLCVMSIVVVLSACTTNPYTGQQEVSKTGLGVGIGAATGAIAGQLIGGNTAATLVGAGLGAAVGGVAGNYMDKQAAELRQQLQGTGVQVVRQANDIQLIMPGDITFATNSSDVKPQFYNTLNSVAIVLKKYNKTRVNVVGYTDNTGAPSYNQTLSEKRAQSVAAYLESQGLNSSRFYVSGFGERNPIATNKTAEGRSLNRRVVITLQQLG